MLLYGEGAVDRVFVRDEVRDIFFSALEKIGRKDRVIAVPPDFTRFHSQSGMITEVVWEYYGRRLIDVLPATGTHVPMTSDEIGAMFGRVPESLFRVHDWRTGTVTLGEVPSEMVREVSGNIVEYAIPVQLNRWLAEGGHDLILSIGQVVPHEVIGLAGYTKNLFVGTGGSEAINRSHFLGAAYGMEKMMGRTDTPVRRIMNYGIERFAGHLPIVHILVVVGNEREGTPVLRGIFIGDDAECFECAAALSLQVNVRILDAPLHKCVVYLDPLEFKSTWLGNKSIYRTRMALADGAELIVLAPGLKRFGEDAAIDRLIRKYGYVGTPSILASTGAQPDLQENLNAAAHLIHGSTEERFEVTYCTGGLSREEIEGVRYRYADPASMMKRYDPGLLKDGFNTLPDGEEIYYISNPALGLWTCRERFEPSITRRP